MPVCRKTQIDLYLVSWRKFKFKCIKRPQQETEYTKPDARESDEYS